ncbi:GTP pyrophosphokinase [Clostridia bacterium]|nr:GTP pyrophosphokinase [Clostridia bacterium]
MDENELFYGNYLETLHSAIDSFIQRLALLEKVYSGENLRFPVEHYKVRIKSADSAKAKLERLGLPVTTESAVNNLFDLAGVRLVCRFFNEVYEITRILQESEGIEIQTIKDYVKNPKPNGYRSIHIILRVPVTTTEKACMQYVEVQIRTIAMDFWASLEHELKYKKHVSDAELMYEELKICADEIISVDLKMQTIYEWLNQCGDAYEIIDEPPTKKLRPLKVD